MFFEIRAKAANNPTADYLASRGEYLNAILIADFLGYDFVDAENLVVFGQNGKINLNATFANLREELSRHERAVIPGFYGTMPDGSVKTMPRGGSDITGSLVAGAIDE